MRIKILRGVRISSVSVEGQKALGSSAENGNVLLFWNHLTVSISVNVGLPIPDVVLLKSGLQNCASGWNEPSCRLFCIQSPSEGFSAADSPINQLSCN